MTQQQQQTNPIPGAQPPGADDTDGYAIGAYQLVTAPNDFSIRSLFQFIESGVVRAMGFHRRYFWDIKQASKLIESIIVGLPIPQIYLYEEERNQFLVIDGQQRLLSLYLFMKERFPIKERQTTLRQKYGYQGHLPVEMLNDDDYFVDFTLVLPHHESPASHQLDGLRYSELGTHQSIFDMRTIRTVVIKHPSGSQAERQHDLLYEIFYRLNTSAGLLTPQEIRMSLYHSPFMKMLYQINDRPAWRQVFGIPSPDLRMKDIEFLLRAFALLIDSANYHPPVTAFLDAFAKQARDYEQSQVVYLESLFESFLNACASLPDQAFAFHHHHFCVPLFEAIFVAVCEPALQTHQLVVGPIDPQSLEQLKADAAFREAEQHHQTSTAHVQTRLQRARELVTILEVR
ncbi:MAG: DUF262 domain-containing protein [Chloroflexaceae bacterium]|nr:DUF262 domain-containing protein [Chloroflexaceae bacterium]